LTFALDPRLAADTLAIGDLALSRALLMNDARFLWVILAPRREGVSELCELDRADRAVLVEEIAAISEALRAMPGVDKINVGALGNIVRQLHVHVVARRADDEAWPGPVWGAGVARPYEPQEGRAIACALREKCNMGRAGERLA
jgi:diadenosine tetraphosphate (Ap4A) HIT family hydrolase